jgi:hypothetical protein
MIFKCNPSIDGTEYKPQILYGVQKPEIEVTYEVLDNTCTRKTFTTKKTILPDLFSVKKLAEMINRHHPSRRLRECVNNHTNGIANFLSIIFWREMLCNFSE